jgi:hypothetical protein
MENDSVKLVTNPNLHAVTIDSNCIHLYTYVVLHHKTFSLFNLKITSRRNVICVLQGKKIKELDALRQVILYASSTSEIQ